MRSFGIFFAVLIVCTASFGPARAHSPYFSTTEKIELPNGKLGELRLLHGDGILWADPIRVLALDEEGRMIARSPPSPGMTLSCRNARCRVFDLAEGTVLELDPSTFRTGAVVPAIDNPDRDLNWEFYGEDDKSWGWRWRKAAFFELIWGNLALARRIAPFVVITFIAGAIAGPALRAAFRRKLINERKGHAMFATRLILRLILILLGAIALFTTYLLAVVHFGPTLELWIAVLVAGAAAATGVFALLRKIVRRLRPATA
ncbi:MAG: hypothetical protein FD139_271 [Methylocystaceae bacterium]|nr:MAG: hypothetical protein FD148_2388 [Methylocystaceae bacterium]KAF0212498.1 MAG: hypothetical protein FD172_1110 [Methylocystaceae bacterium]TXT48128.1 MAG: hypothetical protein FD139_271 [Methylocystaceae bacterium]